MFYAVSAIFQSYNDRKFIREKEKYIPIPISVCLVLWHTFVNMQHDYVNMCLNNENMLDNYVDFAVYKAHIYSFNMGSYWIKIYNPYIGSTSKSKNVSQNLYQYWWFHANRISSYGHLKRKFFLKALNSVLNYGFLSTFKTPCQKTTSYM